MDIHDDEQVVDDDGDDGVEMDVGETAGVGHAHNTEAVEVPEEQNEVADVIEDLLIISTGSIGVKTFNDIDISDTCPFVKVADGNENPAIIRKSTLCWLLSSGDTKISADRLLRVQSKAPQEHLLYHKEATRATREEFVSVSDWCAFRSEDSSTVIGRILAFRYMSGSTRKNQVYSKLDAPTKAPEKNARGLGCLCSWFKIEKNLTLTPIKMDIHGYYDIQNYLCTIPRPRVLGRKLKLSCSRNDIKSCSV